MRAPSWGGWGGRLEGEARRSLKLPSVGTALPVCPEIRVRTQRAGPRVEARAGPGVPAARGVRVENGTRLHLGRGAKVPVVLAGGDPAPPRAVVAAGPPLRWPEHSSVALEVPACLGTAGHPQVEMPAHG